MPELHSHEKRVGRHHTHFARCLHCQQSSYLKFRTQFFGKVSAIAKERIVLAGSPAQGADKNRRIRRSGGGLPRHGAGGRMSSSRWTDQSLFGAGCSSPPDALDIDAFWDELQNQLSKAVRDEVDADLEQQTASLPKDERDKRRLAAYCKRRGRQHKMCEAQVSSRGTEVTQTEQGEILSFCGTCPTSRYLGSLHASGSSTVCRLYGRVDSGAHGRFSA
jgi:hypothetical protein